MLCNKCGNILPENTQFCNRCGNNLSQYSPEPRQVNTDGGLPTNNQILPQSNTHILGNSHNYQTVFYFLLTLLVPSLIALIYGVYSSYRANYYFQDEVAINCISSGRDDCLEEVSEDDKKDNTVKAKFDETSDINDFERQAEAMLISDSKKEKDKCNDTESLGAEETIKNITGVVTSNFCGIDKEYLSQVGEKIKNIYNKYPKLNRALISYAYEDAGKGAYAYFGAKPLGKNRNFISNYSLLVHNSQMYKELDVVKKSYERDVSRKFHPKNTTYLDIVTHELGHNMEFMLGIKRAGINNILAIEDVNKYQDFLEIWNSYTVSKEMVSEAVKSVNAKRAKNGLPPKQEVDLIKEISGYAAAKDKKGNQLYPETLASAFTDYFINNNSASELSIELIPILERELGKL